MHNHKVVNDKPNEKYKIATNKEDNSLIKRTETINTRRQRSNYKLANCEILE